MSCFIFCGPRENRTPVSATPHTNLWTHRESNPGLSNANAVSYHLTMGPTILGPQVCKRRECECSRFV